MNARSNQENISKLIFHSEVILYVTALFFLFTEISFIFLFLSLKDISLVWRSLITTFKLDGSDNFCAQDPCHVLVCLLWGSPNLRWKRVLGCTTFVSKLAELVLCAFLEAGRQQWIGYTWSAGVLAQTKPTHLPKEKSPLFLLAFSPCFKFSQPSVPALTHQAERQSVSLKFSRFIQVLDYIILCKFSRWLGCSPSRTDLKCWSGMCSRGWPVFQ